MPYSRHQKIKFKHCDPAGIVFYPRYFEMINDTVEAFFEDQLGYSFGAMHPNNGVPTVQIQTEFTAPSRLGEVITIEMSVTKAGRTSLSLSFVASKEAEIRFTASATLVHIGAQGRPAAWPDAVKTRLNAEEKGANNAT